MYLTQIPFYPAERAQYRLEELEPTFATLVRLYPQLLKCLGCGTCTKSCPQELKVKDYMAAAMRGDIARVADLSFDCIMCGMCVSRCPAEEAQPNIAILSRRLYAKYLAPHAQHLAQRVSEINAGNFDDDLARMKALPTPSCATSTTRATSSLNRVCTFQRLREGLSRSRGENDETRRIHSLHAGISRAGRRQPARPVTRDLADDDFPPKSRRSCANSTPISSPRVCVSLGWDLTKGRARPTNWPTCWKVTAGCAVWNWTWRRSTMTPTC